MSTTAPRTPLETPAAEFYATGLLAQVGSIFQALRASPLARTLATIVVALLLIIGLVAYAQVRLNGWNKPFYDAISRRDFRDFLTQLGVFGLIAASLLVLNVCQRYLLESLKMRLREALVRDLVFHWMQPRRAFWLAQGSMGVNPDQRMHDDAQKLCDLSANLGVGLVQATILFGSFAGVLWVISRDFSFRIAGADYAVPGFMVWTAILYAGFGSLMSYLVGRRLIKRNAERYAREGELRFTLTRVNEHLDDIALAAGEADERRRIELNLSEVLAATKRLIAGLTHLEWVTAGFGWTMQIVPTLVAAPLYFSGKITFGGLIMAAAAFTQAQASLRWFVDNFATIADWRATLLRVAGFRQALVLTREPSEFDSRIEHLQGEAGCIEIKALEVRSANGRDRLEPAQISLARSGRLLVNATAGADKTLLFRALAGLWLWGSGEVRLPAAEAVHAISRGTPYLPNGTLREVLAYPEDAAKFGPDDYRAALERLGLERLAPLLDETRRWDRTLNLDEQSLLSFARVVLHAPPWLLLDEIFGGLEEDALERVVALFDGPLAETGVIHIGRAGAAQDRLFTQTAQLGRISGEGVGA